MNIKSALRDWLSVSYVTQYPVPPIFSFPLEGKSREAGKGVRGRAPIGCSIAVLTANRRPVSFLLLTLGHACGVRVHRFQRGRFLGLTGPMGRRVRKFDGAFGSEGCGGGFAASFIMPPLAAFLFRAYSQRTADSRQRTAGSRQPTADSRKRTADSR